MKRIKYWLCFFIIVNLFCYSMLSAVEVSFQSKKTDSFWTDITIDELKEWYNKNKKQILKDYFEFLKFKSISARKEYKKDIEATAEWIKEYLDDMNFNCSIVQTHTYPVVYAEKIESSNDYTVMFYAHYDIQPPDPIEKWNTDPFEPTIINNRVYALGASDDKGQLFYTLVSIKAMLALRSKLPINIKICLDGGEESSSPGLIKILPKYAEKFKADALVAIDSAIPNDKNPVITLGIRGIAVGEVEFIGSASDLHSGKYGGIALNPLRALVCTLSKVWNENGRIMIPGFYDDVIDVPKHMYDVSSYNMDDSTIYAFGGEKGYSLTESNWFRPTFEINGMGGGYTGRGFKTVIPAKAFAKISCRLVPNQDPDKILKLIDKFFIDNSPKGIKVKFIEREGRGKAFLEDVNSRIAKSSCLAFQEVFNAPCKKVLSGITISAVSEMTNVLKCDTVVIGVRSEDDQIHSPNESFSLNRFEKGFLVIAKIIQNCANDNLGKG